MCASVRNLTLAAGLLLAATGLLRGEMSSSGDAAAVEQLVGQLDDARFAVRTRASRELERRGDTALPLVARLAASGSPEASRRAFVLLRTWSRSGEPALEEATVAALEEIASHASRPGLEARSILRWRREAIAMDALRLFEEQGAQVSVRHLQNGRSYAIQLTDRWTGNDEDLARLKDLGTLSTLSVQNARISNEAMRWIGSCVELEYLFLGDTAIDTRGLKYLSELENLKYLSLENLRVGDEVWEHLENLGQLEYLGLDGTQVSDQGLVHLHRFPQLRFLWLDETLVTDAGLVHLKQLPQLQKLYLSRTKTGGSGLGALAELPNLVYLSLKEVEINAEAVRQLRRIKQLHSLGLDLTNATDEMVAQLAGHENLQELWLTKTAVTDACLEYLQQLPSLRRVYLNGSQVSEEGVARIREALRNCKVEY